MTNNQSQRRRVLFAVMLSATLMSTACGDDADSQPANNQPANNQPANNQPANNQPANNQPANNQPANNQPANNQPANNQPANNDPGCEPACAEGETCVEGECIPDEPDQVCIADARRCLNEQTVERCNSEGTELFTEPCDIGEICIDETSQCETVICQPGQVLGCASNTAQLVCNETGTGNSPAPCEGPAVCVDGECLTGEGSCQGDDECGNDTYCSANVCLPYPTGPRGDANTGCLQQPYEGEFTPEVQCEWNDGNVIMQPAVVDLDGDEVPEIIFTSWSGGGGGSGRVTVIRGDDCTLISQSPSQYDIEIQASLAVGDIDNDGVAEIVTVGGSGELRAFESDMTLLWESATRADSNTWGGPSIADLDQDGTPEIVHGLIVLDGATGDVRWTRPQSEWRYSLGPLSAVADVDLDGANEIVMGNKIFGPDGVDETAPALAQQAPGHIAIAEFDNETATPEIAVVSSGSVRVTRIDGTLVYGPVDIPNNTQFGGAPNVGDFDGDGRPEIGVAGAGSYVVFDPDCSVQPLPAECEAPGIRWSKPTRDRSSGVTGSSLFDFEGDDQADVVYNDECFLRVYDGATGAVKVAFPNTTNTTYENPVVADVDGDFNSEIVIPANDLPRCTPGADTDPDTGTLPGSRRGVVVLRDVTDRWVNSRPIWNQHTYHITNVNDDGTIPQREENNWTRFNNYRQNLQNEGKALYAPDLTTSDELLTERTACGALTLRANIFNRGSQPVSRGVPVSFFTGDPMMGGQFICTSQTLSRLDPGQGEEVSCQWDTPPNEALEVYVVADASFDPQTMTLDNDNTECFELNNWAVLSLPACQ